MPSRESLQCLVRTDSEMREGAFTEVYAPALCNERSMQLGMSTSGASDGLEFGDQLTTRQMQQRAAKRKTEGFHSKSTVAIVLDMNRITMIQAQFHWSQKKRQPSQHDHISFMLCANSCIVVTISCLNLHRTRLQGMKSVPFPRK